MLATGRSDIWMIDMGSQVQKVHTLCKLGHGIWEVPILRGEERLILMTGIVGEIGQ